MTHATFQAGILDGKVALITGGGSGINLGIAEMMAAHGAHVFLLGRTVEKLEKAAEGIRAKGGKADITPADVRDFAAVSAAMATAAKVNGFIDIVVAGAAGNFPVPAMALSSNGFRSVLEIDTLGTFHTYRAAYEYLRKPGASLISISAGQSFVPMPLQVHVCAAKAGVDMITKTLAMEWGPEGIRINSIIPGPIDNTEGMRRLAPTEDSRAAVLENVPLRQMGHVDDIANLAMFLSSPAGRYITGSILNCDGGLSLSGGGSFLKSLMG